MNDPIQVVESLPIRGGFHAIGAADANAHDPRGADLTDDCVGATFDAAALACASGELVCAGGDVRRVGEIALADCLCGCHGWEGCCCEEGEEGGWVGGEMHF